MPPAKKKRRVAEGEEARVERKERRVTKSLKLEEKVKQPAYESLSAEITRAVGRSLKGYPRGENRAFRALVPRRDEDDPTWTDEQEEEIVALVEQPHSLPNELCKCPPIVDTTWRTCFRFLGCLASDIVGRKNHLVYGTNSHRGNNAYWSQSFCQGLQRLMLHPHFRSNTAKMGLALQWASICRTDDCREHSLNGWQCEVFLMILQDVIRAAPGEQPAVQLEVAQLLYNEDIPREDPTPWYQLLLNIDVVSKRRGNTFDKLPEDMSGLYMVTTEDVNAVLAALDNIRYFSFRLYHHHETYHDTITFTRSSDDRPSKKDVQAAIREVVLLDLRQQKKQEASEPPDAGAIRWPL